MIGPREGEKAHFSEGIELKVTSTGDFQGPGVLHLALIIFCVVNPAHF